MSFDPGTSGRGSPAGGRGRDGSGEDAGEEAVDPQDPVDGDGSVCGQYRYGAV